MEAHGGEMKKRNTSYYYISCFCVSLATASDEYIIQTGDTLWSISDKHYNDTFLWPKLWKFNLKLKTLILFIPAQK